MRKMLFVTVAVCTLLYACEPDLLPRSYVYFDRAAFARAQDKWEARGITDYTFEVFEFWAGPQPVFRITVTEGEIADIEVADAKGQYAELLAHALERIRTLGTIPAIFDQIEALYIQAVERLPGLKKGDGISCDVTYDEIYGFPEEVWYDIVSPSPPDGGFYSITVRNFWPLQAAK